MIVGLFALIEKECIMNSDNKNNIDNTFDEIETCSIDDLLNTIEELENREPFRKSYKGEYETSLIDADDSDEACKSSVSLKNIKKERRILNKQEKNINEEKEESTASMIFGWVKVVAIALVIALLINKFVIANALIPSGSMESTIMTGDRVIGLRTSYIFTSPERGDIVIFKNPDDESKLYIKRIIGVPGDKVVISDGLVYINDSEVPLEEEYLSVTPKGNFGPYEVPEDSYFMLGDNRNVSKDSRYWENTFVKEEKIIAKAIFRYYPSWGLIK